MIDVPKLVKHEIEGLGNIPSFYLGSDRMRVGQSPNKISHFHIESRLIFGRSQKILILGMAEPDFVL